ncbi:MAG: nucleotidyltransferase family protein [Bacteroidota bacterium]|nr:nucleotidyltransferase family protein [Bacteroidota bacterium]
MRYTVEHCAIVILAAGKSSRLGSPKQLLAYRGKSLLQHAVTTALQTTMRPVVVVVGANSNLVKKEMEGMQVEIAYNEGWQEGMASSLRCGLAAVQKMSDLTDGIIFMVCDQPYVTQSLLEGLLQAQHETGLPIVASSYEDKLGTPVLWHKTFFAELMELKGDTGARKLIKQHEDLVTTVAFPKGIIDIDTKKDYEGLLQ